MVLSNSGLERLRPVIIAVGGEQDDMGTLTGFPHLTVRGICWQAHVCT